MFLFLFLAIGVLTLAPTTPLGGWLEEGARDLMATRRGTGALMTFVGIYAASIAFGLPGSLLSLLGGAAFGLWPGLLANLVGALFGSTLAFLEGRYLVRDLARRWLKGKVAARLDGLERPWTAFATVARLRLVPIVPFGAVNFAAGATRAKLLPFVLGTAVGILPSTVVMTAFARTLLRGDAVATTRLGLSMAILAVVSLIPFGLSFLRRRVGAPRSRPYGCRRAR